MRLCDLIVGTVATIVGFSDDTPEESVARFRALGFLQGTRVEVQRLLPFGGPLVVDLGGSAFALDRPSSAQVRVFTSELPR